MFIQTEATPNPATVKFIPGEPVMSQGTASFRSVEDALQSPLAKRLFKVEGVTEVFLGDDFVSVTKSEDREWHLMKPAILGAVMEHYTSGDPILAEGAQGSGHNDEDDSEVVGQIKELLDTRVRPAVAMDGGDITFHRFEEGVVYLSMLGACQGCPSSTATLKMGIENMLRHYIPEVTEVRPVMDGY